MLIKLGMSLRGRLLVWYVQGLPPVEHNKLLKSYIHSIDLLIHFCADTVLFYCYGPVVYFEIRYVVIHLSVFSLLRIALTSLCLLCL